MPNPVWYPVDGDEIPMVWSKELYHSVEFQGPWGKIKGLLGSDSTSVCAVKTDLTAASGSRVRFTNLNLLTGEGRTDTENLEGHEVGQDSSTHTVDINEIAHAWHKRGVMVDQRVPWDFMNEGKVGLGQWFRTRMQVWRSVHACAWTATGVSYYVDGHGNQIDGTNGKFTGFNTVTAPDAYSIWRPNSITADESLTTNERMKIEYIDSLATRAKTRPSGPMRQASINGQDCFVLLIHPYQARDLRKEDGIWFATMQNAIRGGEIGDNPIFSGALGYWNGVLLVENYFQSPGIHSSTGAGVADTRRAVLLGAEGLVEARGKGFGNGSWSMTAEKFDYKRKAGLAGSFVGGVSVPRFKDADGTTRDYNRIIIPTYAKEESWS